MKKIFIYAFFVAIPLYAFAGELTSTEENAVRFKCSSISNEDSKEFCLGTKLKSQLYCAHINNEDKKNYCNAIATNYGGHCSHIRNAGMKEECKSNF